MSSRCSQTTALIPPPALDEAVEQQQLGDLSEQSRDALRIVARVLGRAAARDYLTSSDQGDASASDSETLAHSSANSEEA